MMNHKLRMRLHSRSGFTLIELVMTTLILSILTAVAIPQFIDFRTDARNAATRAALGTFRAALANAKALVKLKEPPLRMYPSNYWATNEGWQMFWRWNYHQTEYPTTDALNANDIGSQCAWYCGCSVACQIYPALAGTPIFDPATGIPENPWTPASYSSLERRYIFNAPGAGVGSLQTGYVTFYDGTGANPTVMADGKGWQYDSYTGRIWANSAVNGQSVTENNY